MCVTFVCVTFVTHVAFAEEKVVMCYYGTWATYRSGLGKFDVADINIDLCTHIIYTFAGIDSQGNVISLDPYLDLPDNSGKDNFRKFTSLKHQNPNLKTILAVGGWNEGSAKYSTMAASSALRKNFIVSASKIVQEYGFDGLDLDWEYPNRRDSVNGQKDVNNFSQLLKELREEFEKHGLILTAAVSSVKDAASLSYDIPTIVQYLDFVNIMTYDMHGAWDGETGHNAPLHKGQGYENVAKDQVYSVDVALEYWLGQGCPPEKLVLGLPLYGQTFQLTNANNNGVRAPSNGPGIAGPYTATNGILGYNEYCQKFRKEIWEQQYDALAKVPYAIQGQNWVSYDDADSLTAKIDYALKYNISGVMVWSIETDDFHGICDSEDFPLLRSINRAVGRSILPPPTLTPPISSTTVTTTPISTTISENPNTTVVITTVPPTTSENPEELITCEFEGFMRNPFDCTSFYICVADLNGGLVPKLFQCPVTLYWDQERKYCNYPDQVQCDIRY
ncbi:unnamed protein product, partial [Brenthis ino]